MESCALISSFRYKDIGGNRKDNCILADRGLPHLAILHMIDGRLSSMGGVIYRLLIHLVTGVIRIEVYSMERWCS